MVRWFGGEQMPPRYRREGLSEDWRANLFSIFVDSLSRRVSKVALWEAFNNYGRVMDVYIHSFVKGNREKETTFAFVRYKFEAEMIRVIEGGNNRGIDGWHIIVKEASYGWSERKILKHYHSQSWRSKNNTVRSNSGENPVGHKDTRSYRDMVTREDVRADEQRKMDEKQF
ncbi:hypothetical protein DITRI_Ditri07aG0039900 [Diplodiscus trichospermus]